MAESPQAPREANERSDREESSDHSGVSARDVAAEAVEEFAGLERRLPRTLWAILTRPGYATLEHRRGRGGDYVPSIRIYALASAIYFATSIAQSDDTMDLGLVFVGGSEPLPSIAPAIVLVAAAPLFAALLGGLFHHAHASFGEYLVFALYFQSALLLVLIGFALLPIPDPADDSLKILYFVGYVGVAARRLWESSWLVAMLKALVSFVFYAIAIMLAFGGILLVQNLVR